MQLFNLETSARSSMLTDQIGSLAPHIVQQDGRLLVPIGVQLDAALLHQDAAEVFEGVECVSCEVASVCALHSILLLGCVDDAGIHAGGGVFVQAGAQIGGPLGLI